MRKNLFTKVLSEFVGYKGLYTEGDYSRIGKIRLNQLKHSFNLRMSAKYEKSGIHNFCSDDLAKLLLETFYAHYLFDTSKQRKPNELEEKFVLPIEKNRKMRYKTIWSERRSMRFTVNYVMKVYEMLMNNMDQKPDPFQDSQSDQDSQSQDIQFLQKAIDEIPSDKLEQIIENAIESAEKQTDQEEAVMKMAGKIGADLTLEDQMRLLSVTNPELIMLIARRFSGIRFKKISKESKHGFRTGVRKGSRLRDVKIKELAYPDEILERKIFAGNLMTRSRSSTDLPPLYVLEDCSGSMCGHKIKWANSVAFGLIAYASKYTSRIYYSPFNINVLTSVDISEDPKRFIEIVTRLTANGGTNIDEALIHADEKLSNHDRNGVIVLITDGEDDVTYKPRNTLASFMISGHNSDLQKTSDLYCDVKPSDLDALKIIQKTVKLIG